MVASLRQNASLRFDLQRDGGNCELDEGLLSMVLLCLFTNKRVPDGVPWEGDRGGYWAAKILGFDWGSLLWTLNGKPNTPENLKLAEEYAVDGCAPMITNGMADEVRASATFVPDGWCRLKVEIRNGRSWLTAWENTVNEF